MRSTRHLITNMKVKKLSTLNRITCDNRQILVLTRISIRSLHVCERNDKSENVLQFQSNYYQEVVAFVTRTCSSYQSSLTMNQSEDRSMRLYEGWMT